MAMRQAQMKNLDNLSIQLNLLDSQQTGKVPYSIFKQAATNTRIKLAENEYQHIIKTYCDAEGNVNFNSLTDKLDIRHKTDVHGNKQVQWYMKGFDHERNRRQSPNVSKQLLNRAMAGNNMKELISPKRINNQMHSILSQTHLPQRSQSITKQQTSLPQLTKCQSQVSNQVQNQSKRTDNLSICQNEDLKLAIKRITNQRSNKSTIGSNSLTEKVQMHTSNKPEKYISAASELFSIQKNNQNGIYIQAAQVQNSMLKKKNKIQMYFKQANIQFEIVQKLNEIFLRCDKKRLGQITKHDFLLKLAKYHVRLPESFLASILSDIQLDPYEQSDEALLIYKNLKDILDIIETCPQTLKGFSNQSSNFTSMQDMIPSISQAKKQTNRVDRLFQFANYRLTEKFKGFRQAFRQFDQNFDGSINFREFVQSMSDAGVNLTLTDFRLIFEQIDFDEKGEIDYFKFCLIDMDRAEERIRLKREHKDKIGTEQSSSMIGVRDQNGKETNNRYRDGKIPKNKDQIAFNKDIIEQSKSATKVYLQKKNEMKLKNMNHQSHKELSDNFVYGIQTQVNCISRQDLKDLLSNKFVPKTQHMYNFETKEEHDAKQKDDFMNSSPLTPKLPPKPTGSTSTKHLSKYHYAKKLRKERLEQFKKNKQSQQLPKMAARYATPNRETNSISSSQIKPLDSVSNNGLSSSQILIKSHKSLSKRSMSQNEIINDVMKRQKSPTPGSMISTLSSKNDTITSSLKKALIQNKKSFQLPIKV